MNKYLFLNILFAITIANNSYAQNNKYIIGVENIQYLPHYTTVNSEYGGIAREILDLFAKYADVELEYRPLPVKRLYLELVEKQIDFKYPDNPRWKVDIKNGVDIIYSNVVEEYIAGAVVKPEQKGKGVEELEVLGSVMGFTPLPFMDLIKAKKITVHENRHFHSLLEQVILGRVDAAYMDVNVASYQLQKILNKPDALVFDSALPHSKAFFCLSTIKHPVLMKVFNEFLKEKAIEIKAIKSKYSE